MPDEPIFIPGSVPYVGRVFSVEVGTVRLPDGAEHEVAIVRHRPSVVLIPILDEGHVMLIRQYRPALGRVIWELPAGSLEPGESAEAAAARECEEEIGLVPGSIARLQRFYPTPGFCDEELIFFRVADLKPPSPDSARRRDPDEILQPEALPIEEARQMLHRGHIIDLKTAYGLTLV